MSLTKQLKNVYGQFTPIGQSQTENPELNKWKQLIKTIFTWKKIKTKKI